MSKFTWIVILAACLVLVWAYPAHDPHSNVPHKRIARQATTKKVTTTTKKAATATTKKAATTTKKATTSTTKGATIKKSGVLFANIKIAVASTTTKKPTTTTKKATGTTKKVVPTTKKAGALVATTKKTASTTKKPIATTKKAVVTTKNMATTKKPVTTTKKLVPTTKKGSVVTLVPVDVTSTKIFPDSWLRSLPGGEPISILVFATATTSTTQSIPNMTSSETPLSTSAKDAGTVTSFEIITTEINLKLDDSTHILELEPAFTGNETEPVPDVELQSSVILSTTTSSAKTGKINVPTSTRRVPTTTTRRNRRTTRTTTTRQPTRNRWRQNYFFNFLRFNNRYFKNNKWN